MKNARGTDQVRIKPPTATLLETVDCGCLAASGTEDVKVLRDEKNAAKKMLAPRSQRSVIISRFTLLRRPISARRTRRAMVPDCGSMFSQAMRTLLQFSRVQSSNLTALLILRSSEPMIWQSRAALLEQPMSLSKRA